MGLLWSRYKNVISWKYSECPECEYSSSCEQKVANIEKCAEEDMEDYVNLPIKLLIKRTIRSMCAHKRKERRHSQGKRSIGFRLVPSSPPDRKAALFCSDLEEFNQCQRSG